MNISLKIYFLEFISLKFNRHYYVNNINLKNRKTYVSKKEMIKTLELFFETATSSIV